MIRTKAEAREHIFSIWWQLVLERSDSTRGSDSSRVLTLQYELDRACGLFGMSLDQALEVAA